MNVGASVKADGLKALGFELLGELRVLLRLSHVHVALQIVIAGITERGDDFLHVELLLVTLGILAPAVDIGADQGFLRCGARALRARARGKRRHHRA